MSGPKQRTHDDLAVAARNALPLLLDVVEAARDALNYGAHDGPCDNSHDEACGLHRIASDRRRARLTDALAALDAAQ